MLQRGLKWQYPNNLESKVHHLRRETLQNVTDFLNTMFRFLKHNNEIPFFAKYSFNAMKLASLL